MAKTPDVEVEALKRFPYRGKPYFGGQRVMMRPADIEDAVVTGYVKRVADGDKAAYRRRDMQAETPPTRGKDQ